MPSPLAYLTRRALRVVAKPLIAHVDVPSARLLQEKIGQMQRMLNPAYLRCTLLDAGGVPVERIDAADAPPSHRAILYLHGGGFISGNLRFTRAFGGVLAAQTGQSVYAVVYRLAPENPYPAALDDVFSAYLHLLNCGIAARDITVVGESAGGGLVYSLCLKLRDKGLPMPGGVVGISPWADMSCSGASYLRNAKRDPALPEEAARFYARLYAGGHEREPYASPIFGDFSGMPRSLIFSGGDEVLLDDAISLDARMKAAGVPSMLIVEPEMWHVYVLFGLPESKKALHLISAFVSETQLERYPASL